MNATQRKYAMERVSAIKSIRERKLRDEYAALRKDVTVSDLVAKLKKSGYALILGNPDQKITSYTDVDDVFDLSQIAGPTAAQTEAHNAALSALNREAENVKDQIMLGDNEEALRVLAAFSEGVS